MNSLSFVNHSKRSFSDQPILCESSLSQNLLSPCMLVFHRSSIRVPLTDSQGHQSAASALQGGGRVEADGGEREDGDEPASSGTEVSLPLSTCHLTGLVDASSTAVTLALVFRSSVPDYD